MTIPDEAVQADKTLWCVNIKGPDDIISVPDHLTAVRMANTFNAWWLDLITKKPLTDNHPRIWAEPIEWPFSEGHGEDVTDPDNEYHWLRELAAHAPSPRAQALEEAAQALEAWGDIYGDNAAKCVRVLSSQPVADGWLPIETAPKDGTDIIVWSTMYRGKPVIVRWEEDKYAKRPIPRWITNDSAYGKRAFVERPPTHWRPLPASPGASE